jgi:electron transfer flavoprotein alpha subunit
VNQGKEEEDVEFPNGRGVVLARPVPSAIERVPMSSSIQRSSVDASDVVQHVAYEAEGGSSGELERAEVIVAMGRGAGGPDVVPMYEALASAIGAQLGGSRPVIDAGWLPRSRQIGVSGVSVQPSIYLGFGVSGALGHQVGMRDSRTIVAINLDEDAPLMALADVRVVADAPEVARALLALYEVDHGG